MASLEDIPRVLGSVEERVRKLVEWVGGKIERKKWSNEHLQAKFGRRSARRIVEDEDTCYMNPCLDYMLVMLESLKRNGLTTTFLVAQLKNRFLDFDPVHMVVECGIGGEGRYVDFRTLNIVEIGRVPFVYQREGYECKKIVRMNGMILSADDSIIDVNEKVKKYGITIGNEDELEKQVAKLQRDNSEEEFQRYLSKISGDIKKVVVVVKA